SAATRGRMWVGGNYLVVVRPRPIISSLSPTYGYPGDAFDLIINGTNLASTTSVNFYGVSTNCAGSACGLTASVDTNNAYNSVVRASLTIASTASPGQYQLTVTNSGGTSAPRGFTVADTSPVIDYITQDPLAPGQSGN